MPEVQNIFDFIKYVQVLEEYRPGEKKETCTTESGITLSVIDGYHILDGDIILSEEHVEMLDAPITRGAILNSKNWPNGIVYYVFYSKARGEGSFGINEADKVYQAMHHYHQRTGVEFRHVSYKGGPYITSVLGIVESNYIVFIHGDGNYSKLGMVGGRQDISLLPGFEPGTAIHELGHALGLLHEQSRIDRDNYINVNYANIRSSLRHNFDKSNVSQTLYGDFDFGSIMLYSSYNTGAIDESIPTMTKKDGGTWWGQRNALSTNDIAVLKTKYPNSPCNKVLPRDEVFIRDGVPVETGGGGRRPSTPRE